MLVLLRTFSLSFGVAGRVFTVTFAETALALPFLSYALTASIYFFAEVRFLTVAAFFFTVRSFPYFFVDELYFKTVYLTAPGTLLHVSFTLVALIEEALRFFGAASLILNESVLLPV